MIPIRVQRASASSMLCVEIIIDTCRRARPRFTDAYACEDNDHDGSFICDFNAALY